MKHIISGSAIALLLMTATPASAEVGGTITRQAPTPSSINTLVMAVLDLFTWEAPIGTLTFDKGTYSATAGCNGISGEYTVDGTSVDFGDSVSTMMYCDGKMENEAALITTFSTATHLTFKDGALVLSSGTTSQRFAATLHVKASTNTGK